MPAALTLLLAGVLLASGAAKLRDPSGMVVLLRQALTPLVPAFALTRALALLEVALGALLLSGVDAHRAPEAAAACSCFGGPAGAPPAQAALRNALLIAAAAVVVLDPATTAWDLPADEVAAAITVAVGLACTWLLGAALARAIGVLGTETHR